MNPEPRAIAALATWLAIAIVAGIVPTLEPVAVALGIVVIVVLAVDGARARRAAPPEVERDVAPSLPVGRESSVALTLRADDVERPLDVVLYDHHPRHATTRGLPARVVVEPGEAVTVRYRLRPTRRGDATFAPSELRIRSPMGLWRSRHRAGPVDSVRVFPDFGRLGRYAVLAAENARGVAGVRVRPRRGEGLELHELREYRESDSPRRIDWKTTARLQRVIAREYEEERNQQVVIALDCGRTMRATHDGTPHFDRALDAVMLLAYVALREGDAVGALTFGGPTRFVEPRTGPRALGTVLSTVHDLEATSVAPDYRAAALRLSALQRRRSLVVWVSNVRDDAADEIAAAVALLRRRHLVVVASLREPEIDIASIAEPVDFDAALRVAAARRYLEARAAAHDALRHRGVPTIDVVPERLPTSLVSRYLDIKRSGAL